MRYRKKPIEIEAFQLPFRHPILSSVQPVWFKAAIDSGTVYYQGGPDAEWYYTIKTLEGDMRANPGDWVIRGINGELYPCKSDIFSRSYEAVPEGK